MITISRPALGLLAIEPLRASLEFARSHLMQDSYADSYTVAGEGHAVVLFPGLGADHVFMSPLAKFCERLGHVCYDWGRGRNMGPSGAPEAWVRNVAADVAEMIKHHSERVTLIGWSLGGLYAREVAKALPDRVRQVITLGSPFANISNSTNVGWLYKLLSGESPDARRSMARKLRIAPPVPTTSIYSRSDGVVAWEACVGTTGPESENIEVESSHLGLVWHPDVLNIIGDRLRQREGEWNSWKGH